MIVTIRKKKNYMIMPVLTAVMGIAFVYTFATGPANFFRHRFPLPVPKPDLYLHNRAALLNLFHYKEFPHFFVYAEKISGPEIGE